MTLIKSISGIRGTIGGSAEEGLSPSAVIKYVAAFGTWVKSGSKNRKSKIILGRDARMSGEMIRNLACGILQSLGIDVIDLGLSTTPTVEMAVVFEKADAGIIITASHNPKNWNALKLLNGKGEFISAKDGEEVLSIAEQGSFNFADVMELGSYTKDDSMIQKHIDKIIALPLVNIPAITAKNFKVAIDCVNSTGGIAVPILLKTLGVSEIIELFCEPNGNFPHNPEPLPENLSVLSKAVVKHKAHIGFAVDPDVDRLAIISETGDVFGEEYTLVAVADYLLKHKKGAVVSNLSSSGALRVVTEKAGQKYYASAVGEVNVVEMMKTKKAVIGGEGNGGVIYPDLHYGRDALVGIALFLSHLALTGKTCSSLRGQYPDFFISKNKIELNPGLDVDKILLAMKTLYKDYPINSIDGIKIDFNDKEWAHLRKSNTEPIIRIYTESTSKQGAGKLAKKIIADIKSL